MSSQRRRLASLSWMTPEQDFGPGLLHMRFSRSIGPGLDDIFMSILSGRLLSAVSGRESRLNASRLS